MLDKERMADDLAARGDLLGAERLLREVIAAGTQSAEQWLKLASINRAKGDIDAALNAIDSALKINPLHFMALLSRGHLLEATGYHNDAARSYLHAIAQLTEGQAIPASLAAAVAHARQMAKRFQDQFAQRWGALAASFDDLDEASRQRVERFTNNTARKTRAYHCQPTHFHYPGIVEREFHDRADFPWLAGLEAEVTAIREEFLALQSQAASRAEPYLQYAAGLPLRQWAQLNQSLDWTAFHLLQNGEVIEANAFACPLTLAALSKIGQPRIGRCSPNAMFSLLKPRTRIPPHTGVANTRLVCHLPLIVPDNCWFRVGDETRKWREGEAFVFDDTIEHEAANDSDLPRIVLIFDVWHPDLSAAERHAVGQLMSLGGLDDGMPL